MPFTSAFGYYSGMASQLSESSFTPAFAATDLVNHTGLAAIQSSDQCHQPHKIGTFCHISSSCSFHLCGDGGITAAFLFVQEYGAHRYEQAEKPAFSSFSFSPDIRPPISSLSKSA
ncbi:MAG: hypothetical protein PHG00_00385 [Methylococcales bacterium]|nr:hypothetical protein [Methylococcales bacterium]